MSNPYVTAILVAANNVTIDPGVFVVEGPLSGVPGNGTGIDVDDGGRHNVVVRLVRKLHARRNGLDTGPKS